MDIDRISAVLKKTADSSDIKFDRCSAGRLSAFRLTFNEDLATESVVTDGKTLVTEVHCVRGSYGTDEQPVALKALLGASVIPGTEKPFSYHDSKAYIMDRYDVYDIHPYLCGEKKLRMPLVYLSYSPALFRTAVDPHELQQRLLGEAHVAAEKDREAASAMRELFGGKGNPFNGRARIVLPSGKTRDIDLMQYADSRSTATAVVSALRESVCSEKQYNSWNWNSVYRLMLEENNGSLKNETDRLSDVVSRLQEKLSELKGSEELNSLFDELTDQLEQEKEQRYLAQSEAARWKSLYESKSSGQLSLSCHEKDLYKGEIRDIVLFTLKKKIEAMEKQEGKDAVKTRMYTVVKDIIDSTDADGTGEEMKKKFSNIVTGAGNMTSVLRGRLQKLGFEPVSDSPHTRMNFCSDSRYTVVFSNTPSDIYTRKNEVSRIVKQIFPW